MTPTVFTGSSTAKACQIVVVEAGLADLVDIDGVGVAQDVELFPGDVAGAADGEARARERVAADENSGRPSSRPSTRTSSLNSSRKRLDQLHVHALGQATDIVVRLDGDRWATGEGDALDHIGVERALRQEIRAAELLCFRFEHLDEQAADGLALDFGVGNAIELAKELRRRIHVHQGML